MRRLLFIAIVLVSCNRANEHRYTKGQQDTIRLASFSRLDEKEAYDFINNYYLPRLDTLITKRQIFVYPLKTRDLLADFLTKIDAKKGYKDSIDASLHPPDLGNDSSYRWDQSKLKTALIISEKDMAALDQYAPKDGSVKYLDSLYRVKWHQKLGCGYVCISYPMYNPYTNNMFIYEWLEDLTYCGNGRDKKFWFKKIGSKWIAN